MQSTASTICPAPFNVSCPLPLPRVQTNCHAPTIRALGWVCCMLHGSRQETRSRLAVVAHKLSDQYHLPCWTVFSVDLNVRWWVHLPRVPTARRRRPGTVVSQGVRASQDFLPMYGNGSFSSASRIPGTPCGYPNRFRFVLTSSTTCNISQHIPYQPNRQTLGALPLVHPTES